MTLDFVLEVLGGAASVCIIVAFFKTHIDIRWK
jgi:hypothetical protein